MSINKIIKIAGEVLDKTKIVVFFLAVLLIPVVYYLHLYKNRDILVWFVFAWLFVTINILFDIHKQVKEKPERRVILKTGNEALPKVVELLRAGKKRQQNVKIFAMTLATVWPRIKEMLEKEDYRNVDIELLQVDPELERLQYINRKWETESKYIHSDIQDYKESNKDTLSEKKISIKVERYKYGPCIHGYLVNNDNLFLSLCQWKKRDGRIELEGHPFFYEHFDNRKDEKQRQYFELFDNWFNHFFTDEK